MSVDAYVPTSALPSGDWDYESSGLGSSADNVWAINSTNTNGVLALVDCGGAIAVTEEILGFEIITKIGNVSHLGVPGASPGEDYCRIRIGLTLDGTSFAGTYYDIDATSVTEITLGNSTDTMGLSLSASDVNSSTFGILYQRPTDLAGEFISGNRSVDFGYINVYHSSMGDFSLTQADGGCSGEIELDWTP